MGERPDEVAPGSSEEVDSEREAEQIRSDIEKTRANMGETIDALQDRLSPERIKEQVKEKVKDQAAEAYESAKDAVKRSTIGRAESVMNSVGDATRGASTAVRDTGSSIVDTVRDNPLPFALIGAGLGILTWRRRRRSDESGYGANRGYGYYGEGYYRGEREYGSESYGEGEGRSINERVRETAGDVAERAQEATREAREAARRAAGRAREQVGHMGERARYGARRTEDRMRDMLRTNPMALGAAVLATGAAVGLALPTTRVEEEYMGEARDQVMDKAETLARDTMGKVKRVAQEAGRTAEQEAQNQGLTG